MGACIFSWCLRTTKIVPAVAQVVKDVFEYRRFLQNDEPKINSCKDTLDLVEKNIANVNNTIPTLRSKLSSAIQRGSVTEQEKREVETLFNNIDVWVQGSIRSLNDVSQQLEALAIKIDQNIRHSNENQAAIRTTTAAGFHIGLTLLAIGVTQFNKCSDSGATNGATNGASENAAQSGSTGDAGSCIDGANSNIPELASSVPAGIQTYQTATKAPTSGGGGASPKNMSIATMGGGAALAGVAAAVGLSGWLVENYLQGRWKELKERVDVQRKRVHQLTLSIEQLLSEMPALRESYSAFCALPVC